MKALAKEQDVPQVTDVAAGQTKCLDLRQLPNNKIRRRCMVLIKTYLKSVQSFERNDHALSQHFAHIVFQNKGATYIEHIDSDAAC